MFSEENFSFEGDGIEPERIVNDEHQVANEFFCAICQGLLWKAKSCASCQHLFCHNCIRTWLQINPTCCPFRCSPYEEKRPLPYIHSLLGRLSIQCRNSSFGCTEIISYDALEQHETVDCEFLTKRCRVCGNYLLVTEIDEHQRSCISAIAKCFICKHSIDRNLLSQHMKQCFQERLDLLIEQIIPSPEELGLPVNNAIVFPQIQDNGSWFARFNIRLERFLTVMPHANLIGFDKVVQTRRQNIFIRIWTMLQMMWLNKSCAAQILLFLLSSSFGFILGFIFATYSFIQNQVEIAIYRSFFFIIIFSGLFSFGLPIFLASISDTMIILFTIISFTLLSSALPMLPLHYFQVYQSSTVMYALLCIILIVFKLSLLMIRFYTWYTPSYISASCLAWIAIFITFHIRRISINRRQRT